MMTLKYPTPKASTPENLKSGTIFTLPPQGEPCISTLTQENLRRLRENITSRLRGHVTLTCNPHRVGLSCCVALTLEGKLGHTVNILVTVSGQESWPTEEEYEHPRWYISVADSSDMLYLVLWLNSITVH
ncbi:acetyltransferase [Klebsiella aerogenes]|nr:acetyltransferase [Klebsiella aerogenes]